MFVPAKKEILPIKQTTTRGCRSSSSIGPLVAQYVVGTRTLPNYCRHVGLKSLLNQFSDNARENSTFADVRSATHIPLNTHYITEQIAAEIVV